MKTKCGNCDNCQLVKSKKYHDHSITSNDNSVNETDILVVCDYSKHAAELIEYFKSEHSEWKYVIINQYLCDDSSFDLSLINIPECSLNCWGNILNITTKTNAKRKFVLGIQHKKLSGEFVYVSSVMDLKKHLDNVEEEQQQIEAQKKYYSFKLPREYYTNKYRLVDVQYISDQNRLIYIFRDKDNKKCYYEYPDLEKNFYWYKCIDSNKIIEKIDRLQLVTGKYRNRDLTKSCYGCDVDITTTHSVDYFLNNEKEAPIVRQNIMFFDIETYQYCKPGVFPNADRAEYPIVAISFRTERSDDFTHVYLLKLEGEIDSRFDELVSSGKYPYITVFDNEKIMLSSFFSRLKQDSVDFLAGWNVNGFDIPYIVNRMKRLEMNPSELSPFGNCYASAKNGRNEITGYIVMDQLKLFKELTYQVQPSYSLNAIANVVLGKGKVQHGGESIDDMYHGNIQLFMDYSQQDTQLIFEIDEEVKHIGLQDEIRRVATVSHKSANSTIGQAEGLYATELKKKGNISRNYTHDVVKQSFPGAYVYESPGGLFEGLLCDFDYTSLYPTIIRTFNIGNDSYIGKIDEAVARAYIFAKNTLKGKTFDIIIDPIHNNKKTRINLEILENFLNKYHGQMSIIGTIFCGHDIHSSINCEMLAMLMSSRKVYKKKMLQAKEDGDVQMTIEYNAKQLAFKILANSLYGVLGNEHWRFYCIDLGKSITLTGREMLKYSATRLYDYMTGVITDNNHPIDMGFEAKAVANDIVKYGDTDSIFVDLTNYLTKKNIPLTNNPDVQREISKVQNFINNAAIPQLLTNHHVNTKYSVMNLKNEFLFDKYYTLKGSKHYCSHVISQEGHPVDFIDIKGLEVKRSEIPPMAQKMLNSMINTIMDPKNKKQDLKPLIDAIADASHEEMKTALEKHQVGAARIVSFSKELEEYKADKIPQHIKGMLMWNELMGSEEFKMGSKGKLWNILGIDLEKAPKEIQDNYHNRFLKKFQAKDLTHICTPEDVEYLPEYFDININKMLTYACKDRADALLQPLWVEDESDLLF